MDEIKEAQCRSTVRSAKQEAIDYMVSRIKYTIGVLKCDSLVPRLVLEAVTKNYTQKSLGQLARVRFESWDEESGDVDDMEEDEPMDDSSDIQGDDDVSDEADEIQAEDGGELSPETMTLIKNIDETKKSVRTHTIDAMVASINFAIGVSPDDHAVPEAVHKVLQDHYNLKRPIELGYSDVDGALGGFIVQDDV